MTDSVPLPPPLPVAATVMPVQRRQQRGGELILAGLVMAFAFLSASFAARNSDFWLHLATGRALVNGEYSLGEDPFCYTTEGVYWANHAWLFDLGLYAGFSALGGAGVVALKAGLVAGLAVVMLRISRQDGPFWISVGCTLLALLAMRPRLLLQPACLSLLLLGICLWLLRERGRALFLLPFIMALWVNVDSWFWLGPITVALFGVGERLSRSPRYLPIWLMPACLAACLASPHHVYALVLPAELSPSVWRSGLREDVGIAQLFASLRHPGAGVNLSTWSYFLLLLLGVVSFAVNRSALRGWPILIWLVFAALAAWQASLVPFFAVVAGPITALNFRSLPVWQMSRLPDTDTQTRGRGRFFHHLVTSSPCYLVILAALALLALAWPGWLQGIHRRDRAVAWEVYVDPSLRRAAETLEQWRESGALPDKVHTFAIHPDVAHYQAWFSPRVKSFLDSRSYLFLGVSADYQRIRHALLSDQSGDSRPAEWQKALRDYNIACLVLYDPDVRRLAPALLHVTHEPERWELLRVDGQAVLIAWKGAAEGIPASLGFDAERAAYTVDDAAALPRAPAKGPAELAEPRPWWRSYFDRPSGSSWEMGAAAVYLRLFEDEIDLQRQRQRLTVLPRHAAGLITLPALPGNGPSCAVALATRLVFEDLFLPDLAERPPALPLLAVRAARLAVDKHPDDAAAWLVLAQAYLKLGTTTTEAAGHARLVPLSQLRYIQIVTALLQAVTLQPDLAPAHEVLAQLFAEHGYLDLALRHGDIQLRLVRRAGPLPGEDTAAFAERIDRLEKTIEQTRNAVEDAENRFAVHSQTLGGEPLHRALLALQQGLAGKALDVLLRSHSDLYGIDGLRLLLDLLLLTGRAQDARFLLDREELRANHAVLGGYTLPAGHRWQYRFAAYDWFDLCQAAAAGNYDRAENALARLRQPMQILFERNLAVLRNKLPVVYATEMALDATPAAVLTQRIARLLRENLIRQMIQNELLVVERADLDVVEGMLLLERGLPFPARSCFRRAGPLYRQAEKTEPALPGEALARRYFERLSGAVP